MTNRPTQKTERVLAGTLDNGDPVLIHGVRWVVIDTGRNHIQLLSTNNDTMNLKSDSMVEKLEEE